MLRAGIPKLTKWGLKQGHLQQVSQEAPARSRYGEIPQTLLSHVFSCLLSREGISLGV